MVGLWRRGGAQCEFRGCIESVGRGWEWGFGADEGECEGEFDIVCAMEEMLDSCEGVPVCVCMCVYSSSKVFSFYFPDRRLNPSSSVVHHVERKFWTHWGWRIELR